VFRIRLVTAVVLGCALAATVAAQDRKFDLKLKNEKGEFTPFYQEMTTDVTQIINVQAQPLTQKQKSTFWYKWNPIKEEKVKDGAEDVTKWTVEQIIEGLEMDIDISGNPIKYSSKGDAPGSSGNPGLLDFFKNLKDTKFTVTLGKNYKVEKVDGKDAFIQKLGAGSPQMDALLKKVMTDDALKEMTDPTYKLFPDGPKKPNDKWEKSTKLNLGPIGSYDLVYKLTYVGPDKDGPYKDKDRIKIETVINYTAPADAAAEGLLFRIKQGSKLGSDPTGSEGYAIFDPKAQRIEFAEIKIKLKGELIVTIGGTDTKVELTQEQTTTIKTKDTSFVDTKPAMPPMPPMPPEKK